MNLKTRLNDLHLGITELSQYLNISRPTMYKFISLYDSKDKKDIPKNVIKLFDYIMKNELLGKNNVVNYIFNEILSIRKSDESNELINQLVFFDKNSKKYKFIEYLSQNNDMDIIIFFLLEIIHIKSKAKRTEAEKEKLKIYEKLLSEIGEE